MSNPHPGLEDDALQAALRDDWRDAYDPLSYWDARSAMFREIDGNSRKTTCLYTGQRLSYIVQPLPHQAAVEHAVPLTRCPSEARSDLHQMFPVHPEARGARVQLHYGSVLVPIWSEGGSRAGPSSSGWPVFEVRSPQRGAIARAMFYVSTMYDHSLEDQEEATLRDWHAADRPDEDERRRHRQIEQRQGASNPFVRHPDLTDRISDF